MDVFLHLPTPQTLNYCTLVAIFRKVMDPQPKIQSYFTTKSQIHSTQPSLDPLLEILQEQYIQSSGMGVH